MIAAVALAWAWAAHADGTVYVQSFKAKIYAAPEFGAVVLAEAARGDALPVIETTERWCKVKLGDRSGWIPRLVIGNRAPLPGGTLLESPGAAGLELQARRRASSATTAGAARGLTYEDRRRADQAGVADYAAIERMEAVAVSEEEALAFVAKGTKP